MLCELADNVQGLENGTQHINIYTAYTLHAILENVLFIMTCPPLYLNKVLCSICMFYTAGKSGEKIVNLPDNKIM